MWQAAFAWNGFYDCGMGLPNSNIHILGHSLSNFYDTPHGAAMSVTILATMRYYLKERAKKYADFAREVFKIEEKDDRKAAQAASTPGGLVQEDRYAHHLGGGRHHRSGRHR